MLQGMGGRGEGEGRERGEAIFSRAGWYVWGVGGPIVCEVQERFAER